jgi:hypothetical protein
VHAACSAASPTLIATTFKYLAKSKSYGNFLRFEVDMKSAIFRHLTLYDMCISIIYFPHRILLPLPSSHVKYLQTPYLKLRKR